MNEVQLRVFKLLFLISLYPLIFTQNVSAASETQEYYAELGNRLERAKEEAIQARADFATASTVAQNAFQGKKVAEAKYLRTLLSYKKKLQKAFAERLNQLARFRQSQQTILKEQEACRSELLELNPLFNELWQTFQRYKQEEDNLKKAITDSDLLRISEDAESITVQMFNLRRMEQLEQAYATAIQSQVDQILTRKGTAECLFKFNVIAKDENLANHTLPRIAKDVLDATNNIRAYAKERIAFGSKEIHERIAMLDQRRQVLIDNAIAKDKSELEQKSIKQKQRIDFSGAADALITKELSLAGEIKKRLPFIQLKALRPYFEFYQGSLSFQEPCEEFVAMGEDCPAYVGCLTMRSIFRTAEQFLKTGARFKVQISLKNAQTNAPKKLRPLVGALEKSLASYHAKGNTASSSDLLALILAHDSLLWEWNLYNSKASVSKD